MVAGAGLDGSLPQTLAVLPDGALLADGDARVVAANPAAERILESPIRLGAHLAEVVCLQDREGNEWFRCADPYDGLRLRTRLLERSWWTASGREVLLTARIERERPGGRVTRLGICLRSAEARERAERSRSELVATVAHELRSPLTGVKGFTSTLLAKWERLTDSQKLLMLRTVDADADRLTRLITELLDVARIDTGRLSVRREPVRLGSVVGAVLAPVQAPAGRSLHRDLRDDPLVWADRDRLAQVVSNLVENAFRHGEGDVTVRVADGSGTAEILVDDEGPGIAEPIRTRVFTKFWRTGSGDGTGLGLFIVSGIVAAHGGTVTVEDAPSGGARMRIRLPVEPVAA